MARVKGGMSTKKRRNRVLKLAKGYREKANVPKQFRTAKQAVMKSLNYAYVGRKLRKENSEDFGLHVSMLQLFKWIIIQPLHERT